MKLGGEAVIVIIIIIAAFFLAGGTFTGFDDVTFVTPTPVQIRSQSVYQATINNVPSQGQWSILYISQKCSSDSIGGYMPETVNVTGESEGYLLLEVQNNDGNYQRIASYKFPGMKSTYILPLHNANGFGTHNWRLSLFSNGILSNKMWSGGELRAINNGLPTNCK